MTWEIHRFTTNITGVRSALYLDERQLNVFTDFMDLYISNLKTGLTNKTDFAVYNSMWLLEWPEKGFYLKSPTKLSYQGYLITN
jgi:hypothetical protein